MAVKIKRRSIRILATIATLLFIISGAITLIYCAGAVSPLAKSLIFGIIFGTPLNAFGVMMAGVITLLPFAVAGFTLLGLYRLGKRIYKNYS